MPHAANLTRAQHGSRLRSIIVREGAVWPLVSLCDGASSTHLPAALLSEVVSVLHSLAMDTQTNHRAAQEGAVNALRCLCKRAQSERLGYDIAELLLACEILHAASAFAEAQNARDSGYADLWLKWSMCLHNPL